MNEHKFRLSVATLAVMIGVLMCIYTYRSTDQSQLPFLMVIVPFNTLLAIYEIGNLKRLGKKERSKTPPP